MPIWMDDDDRVRVLRLTEPEEAMPLVRLFERIAEAEGWKPEGALRLWLDRSAYFTLEVGGQLAGGIQLVFPDAAGKLPFQTLWPEVPVADPDRSAHAAILAIDAEFRGRSALFWLLAVEMWRHCAERGVSTLFLEATPRVLPLYRRLGWPLRAVGDLRMHWGEDCRLCSLDVCETAAIMLRRSGRSPLYRRIVSQAFRLQVPKRGGPNGAERVACRPAVRADGAA